MWTGLPDGSRLTPTQFVVIWRSLRWILPVPDSSTSDSPGSRATSKSSCTRGRRKSALTTSTRLPNSASTAARCAAVVVLPSPADGDVMSSTWASVSGRGAAAVPLLCAWPFPLVAGPGFSAAMASPLPAAYSTTVRSAR